MDQNRLLRRQPDLQVFLATDKERVKRLFEKSCPSIITTQPDIRPPPAGSCTGQALHMGPERPDPTEVGAEAPVDLYPPAACDYLIVDPGSSFGRLALWLSEAPAADLFAVLSRGKPVAPLRRWTR